MRESVAAAAKPACGGSLLPDAYPMDVSPLGSEEIAVSLLLDAQELLQRGWCQNVAAVSQNGRAVEPTSIHARAWSVLGALTAAYRSYPAHNGEARVAFGIARRRLTGAGGNLLAWNDDPDRTREQVLATFQAAVADFSL
jgi:hypothetical protein